MKPNASQARAACLLLLLACALPHTARGQSRQPPARKFDEFTTGTGGAYSRWARNYEAEEKELKARVRVYAAQLRKEGARPYAITYGPRVVEYEYHDRSVASLRASALWPRLTEAGFDWQHINWVDGGFREYAATELWTRAA